MPKRKCIFNEELKKKYVSFKQGKSDCEVNCLICRSTISIANKGKSDIEEHIASKKHQNNVRSSASTSNVLNSFVVRKTEDIKLVAAAEATLCFHTVCHHQSYNSLNCTISMNKKIYFDSDIGKKVTCARTKATATVNNILGPFSVQQILKELDNISYISVSTDASNHLSTKMFPIVLQYFNFKDGGTKCKLIDIIFESKEDSTTISDLVIDTLTRNAVLSKCIAFCGDNCNTNFGGRKRQGKNNVYSKLKDKIKSNLIGIGCPAHVLNNAVHHGCDSSLPIDIDVLIFKIYNYFNIYSIRTEQLKDFCDFVDNEYKQLLNYSKTRWLSLLPGINRLLHMFEPLKSYFRSIENAPKMLIQFFENQFSEAYLLVIQSYMSIFHVSIQQMERSENSVIETMSIIKNIYNSLEERIKNDFMPLQIMEILKQAAENGFQEEVIIFKSNVNKLYKSSQEYLQLRLVSFQEFDIFKWMNFQNNVIWSDVVDCLQYIAKKDVIVNDTVFFDQWCNLKAFMEKLSPNEAENLCHAKWAKYFNTCVSEESYSELLKLAQYFFAIPSHNANVERIFSLIQAQWTKERNKLLPNSVKGLILTKYNFQNFDCCQFYDFILNQDIDRNVLLKIGK